MFKTQKTIDNFFVNPSKASNNYQIKRYFYLIWENKFTPSVQAYWSDTKPLKVNFIEQVSCNYIKQGYYFYICGYFKDYDEKAYNLQSEKIYKNIPYLKSHLQKCIRKKNDMLAIPTCYHLLKLDFDELIRRLPIIMLEDTTLHESFTTLIWLMIANSAKKFKMKVYIYEWLLGVVYTLCKIDEVVIINSDISDKSILEQLNSYNDLEPNIYSLLYSIHLRIAYGGCEPDMLMLKSYLNTRKVNTSQVRPIKITVADLSIDDWDISAIDYHCNSAFLRHISKKYDDIEEEELKKMIWCNSSSINTRLKQTIYNKDAWNQIKEHVAKTQKYLLTSAY